MRVPREWICELDGPRGSGRLECAPTTDLSYGLGRGSVAGYDFDGSLLGESVTGAGYLEYVDVAPALASHDRGVNPLKSPSERPQGI